MPAFPSALPEGRSGPGGCAIDGATAPVNELEALRLYGLPEAAPALLYGTPALPSRRRRELIVEAPRDVPSLAPGVVHLVDVAVPDVACRGPWASLA